VSGARSRGLAFEFGLEQRAVIGDFNFRINEGGETKRKGRKGGKKCNFVVRRLGTNVLGTSRRQAGIYREALSPRFGCRPSIARHRGRKGKGKGEKKERC